MFDQFCRRYFLTTKFTFLRLFITSFFVISKPTPHFCEFTELAFYHRLVLFLVSLWHTHSTYAAFIVLSSAPHLMHPELGFLYILAANATEFGLFSWLLHFSVWLD